jgi:hypothetical protein
MYLRSNKKVFDITKLSLDKYARSLGLEVTPKIKYLKTAREEKANAVGREAEREGEGAESMEPVLKNRRENSGIEHLLKQIMDEKKQANARGSEGEGEGESDYESPEDDTFDSVEGDDDVSDADNDDGENESGEESHSSEKEEEEGGREEESESESESESDDILIPKENSAALHLDEKEKRIMTSRVSNKILKKMRKGTIVRSQASRIVFDEEGNPIDHHFSVPTGSVTDLGKDDESGKRNRKRDASWIESVAMDLKEVDERDRINYKTLKREKKKRKLMMEVRALIFWFILVFSSKPFWLIVFHRRIRRRRKSQVMMKAMGRMGRKKWEMKKMTWMWGTSRSRRKSLFLF